jgi:putative ABC transport system permease protein
VNLALLFARRELRSGVAGFRIFLSCLALGVAALAAAGSTADAFRHGLAAQAASLLGGDVAVSVDGRPFTAAERSAVQALGAVTETLRVRAMALAPSGARRLIEIRGVDAAYPLVGTLKLEGEPDVRRALAVDASGAGAAVEPALLERLGLKLGDRFTVGQATFVARAVIAQEPDRLGRGFALGPGVLVSRAALEGSGLIGLDSLFGETLRVAFPRLRDPQPVVAALQARFAGAGLDVRGRSEAAAGLKRLIDQLEYFLGFVGLAALIAGGLGVSTAVASYLETRKLSIAVLKALGAPSGTIGDVYLIQIGVLSVLGVGIGAAVGAATPLILGATIQAALPIPALFAVYPSPLLKACAFGLLAAAAFSLLPLGRARTTPPAALFRRELEGAAGWGRETLGAGLAAAGLVALTVVTAPTPLTAAVMVAGVALSFGILWALGVGSARLAGRLRGLAHGPLRVGLANLAGPRSAARTAAPAIGLGVALLVAVVLLQSNLVTQIRAVAPNTAPSLVFTQIPDDRALAFDALVARSLGPLTPDRYRRAPFATGRITGIDGAPVDPKRIRPDQKWAFDRDVTLAALGPAPPDANVTAGAWWPADYTGPPLVMLEERIAQGAGLKPGDRLTLSLLGRTLDVRIAGLRHVEWGGFGATFPLVIDPDAVAGAGLRHVAVAKADAAQERRVLADLARDFPAVNIVSVREQLESAAKLFDQLAVAVRAAAGVAGLAGVLVLIGSVAATARERAREAALLKVLGASRGFVLLAYAVEYAAVGAIAGGAGLLLGTAAAWPIVAFGFRFAWTVDWRALAAVLGGVSALSAAGGLVAAFSALSQRPAPVLRAD